MKGNSLGASQGESQGRLGKPSDHNKSPPAQVRHLSILCFSRILHALNHWLGAAWGSVALVQTWGWISKAAAGAFD